MWFEGWNLMWAQGKSMREWEHTVWFGWVVIEIVRKYRAPNNSFTAANCILYAEQSYRTRYQLIEVESYFLSLMSCENHYG